MGAASRRVAEEEGSGGGRDAGRGSREADLSGEGDGDGEGDWQRDAAASAAAEAASTAGEGGSFLGEEASAEKAITEEEVAEVVVARKEGWW